MNALTKNIAALVTFGFGLAPLLSAQQPGEEQKQEPQAEQQQGQEAAKDVQALIRGLGDRSYKVRVQSERQLRQIGEEAAPALRKAAENSDDAEVQWRARRLLRQIENGGDAGGLRQRGQDQPGMGQPGIGQQDQPGIGQPGFGNRRLPDVQRRFDDLFQQLERDFGIDIPRHGFFQDDFFQDLRGQMDTMQKQMQALRGEADHGISMRVGPDGVHVEVKTKNEQGEEETKTYEAPDLQTFRQKYPGVLERNGLGGGFRLWTSNDPGNGRRTWTLPFQQPQQDDQDVEVAPPVDAAPPPADKRLGVLIRSEIPADVRDYLGLEPGQGLMVEEVQEGTLAQAAGVAAGDIVLQVGGKDIGTAADVQQALAGIDAGAEVKIEVLRKGKPMTLSGKKPAPETPSAPSKLQRRR